MDDFISLAQGLSRSQLTRFTRLVLHGIHSVFPLPDPDENKDNKPISIKTQARGWHVEHQERNFRMAL